MSFTFPFFSEGKPRQFRLQKEGKLGPHTGKYWLLLTGTVGHITGTDSILVKNIKSLGVGHWRTLAVPSASATATYPLFGMHADDEHSQFTFIILDDTQEFYFRGGTGAVCDLEVWEF
jgi:hypothetical protein